MLDVTTERSPDTQPYKPRNYITRGSIFHNAVVRLAGEGVPIGVLSRAFNFERREVATMLVQAQQAGTLAKLPAQDWPDGATSGRRTAPHDKVPLDEVERLSQKIKVVLPLARLEARTLALLLMRGHCTKGLMHTVIARPHTLLKVVDVTVCKLRQKLAADPRTAAIQIETVFGQGYTLGGEGRRALGELIGEGEYGIAAEPA